VNLGLHLEKCFTVASLIVLVIGWLQAAQGERDGLMAGYWLYRYTGMDFRIEAGAKLKASELHGFSPRIGPCAIRSSGQHHGSESVVSIRTSAVVSVVPINPAARSLGPCRRLHSSVPVIAKTSRAPARVSVSNIQTFDIPLPL